MLPKLFKKIDSQDNPESPYCQSIKNVARMLENPHGDATLSRAKQIKEERGIEAAEQYLIAEVNRRKKEEFDGWRNYLIQGNPLYRDNLAFQFLSLQIAVESSDRKTLRPPISLNAEALARLHEGIRSNSIQPNQNIKKEYVKSMIIRNQNAGKVDYNRWLVFKGGNGQEAEELSEHCQDTGWCIAIPGMSHRYLRHSSYAHIMMTDGMARVALMVLGNQVMESEGQRNEDPGDYWPQVLLYCAVRMLAFPENAAHFRNPNGDEFLSRKIGAERASQRYADEVASLSLGDLAQRLKDNCYLVQFVSPAQIQDLNFEELIRDAWRLIISEYPAAAAIAPQNFGRNPDMRNKWISKLESIAVNENVFFWSSRFAG